MAFGEKLSPTAAIASILSAYPFSVGLLRELLQNSDDAKASKQIFVLDLRTHGKESLYDNALEDMQGPALLAFNDALFSDTDWEAVQTIYESSKISDTSKIGKYGIGFRSCYHVTDTPQILSGSSLAIFDPHRNFASSGGATFDFVENADKYDDQISGFDFFIPPLARRRASNNTIIRLPLRTTAGAATSNIKKQAVEPDVMRQLFRDFIQEEINIVLLFLTSILSIEIWEIDDRGRKCLVKAEAVKSDVDIDVTGISSANTATHKCSVQVKAEGFETVTQTWRVFHASYPDSDAAAHLSNRVGFDAALILQTQKLLPKVAIAIPISPTVRDSAKGMGRLYTYLPLPLSTGFPCHIHALFALTPDRQHLRNGEETGLVEGVDSALVAWNRLLFEVFIPSTWASLLPVLLEKDAFTSIYNAWPPSQPAVKVGDFVYWNDLPSNVLLAISRNKLAVWPVVGVNNSSEMNVSFSDLGSLLVATKDDDPETLMSLASAGVKMTQPPEYIKELLLRAKVDFVLLDPETARQVLLGGISQLSSLHSRPTEVDRILCYLLSTHEVTRIVGMPVIRLVSGIYCSLQKSDDIWPTHTLLNEGDMDVFGHYDEDAINIALLPSACTGVLLQDGPDALNIERLTSKRVIQYIREAFKQFGLNLEGASEGPVSQTAIHWVILFWKWLENWHYRSELYPLIRTFHLVPTSGNILVSCDTNVFRLDAELDAVSNVLKDLAIHFLHHNIDNYLPFNEQGILKAVKNIHHILDQLPSAVFYQIGHSAAQTLREHLSSYVAASCYEMGPLGANHQAKLRALPIYPILSPALSKQNRHKAVGLGCLPEGHIVKGVLGMSVIPVVRDVIFLDGCASLLSYLQDGGEMLHASGVLILAIDNLASQPIHLQSAILKYLVDNRDNIASGLFRKVAQIPFLNGCGDGASLQAPCNVFDPECEVADLLHNDDRCARMSSAEEKTIVQCLRSLCLLKDQLEDSFIEERAIHIAQNSNPHIGSKLSLRLLGLIVGKNYDCSNLRFSPTLRWLPTAKGLISSQECHHHDAHQSELFDEGLVELAIEHLSASLIKALGWAEPLSISTLQRQLQKVLTHAKQYAKLLSLIRELGRRVDSLSEHNIKALCHMTSTCSWVPISQRCLISTSHAVLNTQDSLPPGFHTIPGILVDDYKIRKFLTFMGCVPEPATTTLLKDLHALQSKSSTQKTLLQCIALVNAIVRSHPSDEQRVQVLLPDVNGHLYPIAQVYYNDLGHQAPLVKLPEDIYLAHPKIDVDLATRLKMTFLGLSELNVWDDDEEEDMGEKLTTRISNVLRQYTVEQAFGEFVSNAADAKAKSVGLLVDERSAATSRILSPSMASFQRDPSLVIYNDAIFQEKDFQGIKRIGTGGKEGNTESIGQFGLGALSMFHFTEIAMIVSGSKVMFLDPSKKYLSFTSRASFIHDLSFIKRVYGDHLAAIDGLFNFNFKCDSDFYPGTIFRLPLRTVGQARDSMLSSTTHTAADLHALLAGHYQTIAPQTLFFTQLHKIYADDRDKNGVMSGHWSILGTRDAPFCEGDFRSQKVVISTTQGDQATRNEEWLVVSSGIRHLDLPTEFIPLIRKYRLREPIMAGLAANLTKSTERNKVFSALPLPLFISLSSHLNASFILAEDRRSIRFDGDGLLNPESRYNHWLLADLLPPLYLFFLDTLQRMHDHSSKSEWWKWWPGNTSSPGDPISAVLINSFYSRFLESSDRHICCSLSQEHLRPRDAFLLNDETAIAKVILQLRPRHIIQLPYSSNLMRHFHGKIKTVDPQCVRDVILQNCDHIKAAYVSKRIRIPDIEGVIRFLLQDGEDTLMHLPLLPLSNGTLAAFERVQSSTECYFVWSSSNLEQPLFPLDRLVDRHLNATTLLAKGLNISKLTGPAVRNFIADRIPEVASKDVTAEERTWIDHFWIEFKSFSITSIDIALFPLVPTAKPSHFVSLSHCSSHTSLIMPRHPVEPNWLLETLAELEATVIRMDKCHASIESLLRGRENSWSGMNTFLRFLQSSGGSALPHRFSGLQPTLHSLFAKWARENMYLPEKQKALRFTACNLPIWPSLGAMDEGPFLTAFESKGMMLPTGVLAEMAIPFLRTPRTYVLHNSTIRDTLKIKPLTFAELRAHLVLPKTLPTNDLDKYKQLLRVSISHDRSGNNLLVPDSSREMVSAGTLYARSQPVFVAAFLTRQHYFIHASFADLESALDHYGLTVGIDLPSFEACARVLHEDISGYRRVERAEIVYRCYNDHLPVRVGDVKWWRRLDSLRFIPRHGVRHRSTSFDPIAYTRALPSLVSPKEVLRPDQEAVAWTQRGFFQSPPDLRLLVADIALGVPSVKEVVEHLRVLALKVAQDHPSNAEVLSDITKTYRWLEDHSTDLGLGPAISKYNKEPLFLNVDKVSYTPGTQRCVWHCADQIFFDIDDSGDQYGVRKFLLQFSKLLKLAGVVQVTNPVCPVLAVSSAEAQLSALRASIESMRQNEEMTDVNLTTSDGGDVPAHRLILSTVSEYFKVMFCGSFMESRNPSPEDPVSVLVKDCSVTCLRSAVEFIYSGAEPTLEDPNDLIQILLLSHYWGVSSLNAIVQNQLVQHVSLHTYQGLKKAAATVSANTLTKACNLFEKQNASAIRKLKKYIENNS